MYQTLAKHHDPRSVADRKQVFPNTLTEKYFQSLTKHFINNKKKESKALSIFNYSQ